MSGARATAATIGPFGAFVEDLDALIASTGDEPTWARTAWTCDSMMEVWVHRGRQWHTS